MGIRILCQYWLICSPRFIQFVPLYIMLSSFYIDHISGAWPLGNLLNLGLFDRRPGRLLSPPPLGQGQKRPAGEHFQLMFHELDIIIWRLVEVDIGQYIADLQILLLPFLVTPLLIYILRRFLTWWYHRFNALHTGQLWWLVNIKANIADGSQGWILILMTGTGKLQRVTAS